ncbi:MAG: hypothetical protein Q4B12_05350 [Bowdeniella nasicola]|nr:hypothetical protein [Bowdeniella nasicola]
MISIVSVRAQLEDALHALDRARTHLDQARPQQWNDSAAQAYQQQLNDAHCQTTYLRDRLAGVVATL